MTLLGPKALAIIAGLVSPDIDARELECLSANIYHEARGEQDSGLAWVAAVTMNRVHSPSFPDTICGVVKQRGQFSWTHDGRSDRPEDLEQITRAIFFAYDAMAGNGAKNTDGATHYYAPAKVSKLHRWMKEYAHVADIGGHRFMRKP